MGVTIQGTGETGNWDGGPRRAAARPVVRTENENHCRPKRLWSTGTGSSRLRYFFPQKACSRIAKNVKIFVKICMKIFILWRKFIHKNLHSVFAAKTGTKSKNAATATVSEPVPVFAAVKISAFCEDSCEVYDFQKLHNQNLHKSRKPLRENEKRRYARKSPRYAVKKRDGEIDRMTKNSPFFTISVTF